MEKKTTLKVRRGLFLAALALCLFAAIGGGGGCGSEDKGACVGVGGGCGNFNEAECDLVNGIFYEDKKCSDLGYS